MTEPLAPPPKKDPQKRSTSPTRPPELRSRASLGLTAAAAEGRFSLQQCSECGAVQYPPRDACHVCLGTDLPWRDQDPHGTLLAETTVRTSTRLYFRERAPWRMGAVKLNAGPVILCHIHSDSRQNGEVLILNRLDRAGQGVLLAVPIERTQNMEDDPLVRSLSCDPKHRRILVSDGRNPSALALVEQLFKAGAAKVFVGESETWRPNPGRADLSRAGADVLPLDLTDTASVRQLAAEIGGKTDILINNARFMRPGGALARDDTAFAQQEMEINYFGLLRLAQAFGPGLCARTSDGVNSAVAWVNILSVYALSSDPGFGCYSASNAAAYSLSQSLRAEFRDSGLRVMNAYCGPTEDEWYQLLPPPKVTPAALARSVIAGLQDGLEDVWCGDVAKDIRERWRHDPKVLEREMTMGQEEA